MQRNEKGLLNWLSRSVTQYYLLHVNGSGGNIIRGTTVLMKVNRASAGDGCFDESDQSKSKNSVWNRVAI